MIDLVLGVLMVLAAHVAEHPIAYAIVFATIYFGRVLLKVDSGARKAESLHDDLGRLIEHFE